MTREELARMVLAVLAAQAEYFRTRDSGKLRECKDAERRLSQACKEILNPPTVGLFDEAK